MVRAQGKYKGMYILGLMHTEGGVNPERNGLKGLGFRLVKDEVRIRMSRNMLRMSRNMLCH